MCTWPSCGWLWWTLLFLRRRLESKAVTIIRNHDINLGFTYWCLSFLDALERCLGCTWIWVLSWQDQGIQAISSNYFVSKLFWSKEIASSQVSWKESTSVLGFLFNAYIDTMVASSSLAEVGLQHIFGSAIGAMFGAGIVNASWYAGDILRNASWFAFGMCTIGLVANIIGWTYKIPQTGMLMVLSCSMIVFCNDKPISATLFMISRIVGMFAGVMMSLILALTVYPTAATQEVRHILGWLTTTIH